MGSLSEQFGASKTTFPAVYEAPGFPYLLVDTRGMFDTRFNAKDQEAAASILLEMIIKHARTVRLVFLCKYSDIRGGIASFNMFGTEMGKLFKSPDLEMLLAFNNFIPSSAQSRQFASLTAEQQYPEIVNVLKQRCTTYATGKEKDFNDYIKGLLEMAQNNGVIEDTEAEDDEEEGGVFARSSGSLGSLSSLPGSVDRALTGLSKLRTVASHLGFITPQQLEETSQGIVFPRVVKQNLDRVTYIDVTKPFYRARFLEDIKRLKPVDKAVFRCSSMNSERLRFNQVFENVLTNAVPTMQRLLFSLQSTALVEHYIGKENEALQSDRNNSKRVESATEEETNKLIQQYHAENNIRLLHLKASTALLSEEMAKKQSEIAEFLKKNEEILDTLHYESETGRYFWAECAVCYPRQASEGRGIPILRYECDPAPPAVNVELVRQTQTCLELNISSTTKAGKVWEVITSVATLGVKGIFATSKPFSGDVMLYARPADIHPDYIPSREMAIRDAETSKGQVEKEIQELEESHPLTLDEAIEQSVTSHRTAITNLNSMKKALEHQKTLFLAPPKGSPFKYKNQGEEWLAFKRILDQLYSETEKDYIREFEALFTQLDEAGVFCQTFKPFPVPSHPLSLQELFTKYRLLDPSF